MCRLGRYNMNMKIEWVAAKDGRGKEIIKCELPGGLWFTINENLGGSVVLFKNGYVYSNEQTVEDTKAAVQKIANLAFGIDSELAEVGKAKAKTRRTKRTELPEIVEEEEVVEEPVDADESEETE